MENLKTFDAKFQFGNPRFGIANRADYDRVCGELGIIALTDSEISEKSYFLHYGEFGHAWTDTWARDQRVGHLAAVEYLLASEKTEKENRKPSPAPEMRKCSCGHTVPVSQVMNASMGSSCPDCYDRMSE